MSDTPRALSEEARASMTAAASSASRVNKPRWLVYLGGLLVAVAFVFTLVQVYRRATAESELAAQRKQLAAITLQVQRLKAMEAADEAIGGSARANPDPHMFEKLRTAAKNAGLTLARDEEGDDVRGTPSKSLKRKRYSFSLVNQPAEGVFNWLKTVTTSSAYPGVQLNALEMRPGEATSDDKAGWKVEVVLTRWERQQ